MKKNIVSAIAICLSVCTVSVCAVSAEEAVPEYDYELFECYSDDPVTEEIDPMAIWLEIGAVNNDVYELQSMLSRLGYYAGTLDGDFGSYTEAALKQFQNDYGLYVDGIAGDITMAELQNRTGQAPAAVQQPVASGSDISNGATGNSVIDLQNMLARLGYYHGNVDGDFGSYTEAALRQFQSDYGLYVDGIAGNITMAELKSRSEQAPAAVQQQVAASSDISRGMTGNAVIDLQTMLTKLGYYHGNVDGDFGSYTEDAIKRFQQNAGLYVDGVVGPKTMAALTAQNEAAAQNPPVVQNESSDLALGANGEKVKQLQQLLADQGYYHGNVDGDFGPYTEEVVRKYQQAKGLYVDGVAGPLTLKALQDKVADQPAQSSDLLREGMVGDAVRSLQAKLAELGYSVVVDGDFGANTKKAVMEFQTLNGLYVDGEAGPLTLAKLNNNPVVYSEDAVVYDGTTLTEDIAVYMKNLFNAVTTGSMSKEEKLYATYSYIADRNNYPYMQNRIPYYRGIDWPVVYAHDMMYEGGSYCHGYASLFGYAAVLSGYNNVHWCQNGYHAWVDIDGYVYDPVFRDSSYATDVYGWTYDQAISYNGYLGAGYEYMNTGYEGTYYYIKAPNF